MVKKGGDVAGILFIRILFFILGTSAGYLVAQQITAADTIIHLALGLATGIVLSLSAILIEKSITRMPLKMLIGGGLGLMVGVFFGEIIHRFFTSFIYYSSKWRYLNFLLNVFFGYIGLTYGWRRGKKFDFATFKKMILGTSPESSTKILDTSVIIDGRIADVSETGFIEGTLVVPRFVLKELQHIADSSDVLKRNRGRRGLDILHKIQKKIDVEVEIVETDFSNIREVDAKLVELGKVMNAKIVTNDFNLNKIAELQGVHVLNINELANAVKPVVLPGEVMKAHIMKEGKEYGQGVAYLDDGTMVVVDNAADLIGQNVDVAVTSVLQTTAGRMIFSRLKEDEEERQQ